MDIYPIWLLGGSGVFGVLTGLMVYRGRLFKTAITTMQRPDYPHARIARPLSRLMARSGYILVSGGLAELCLGLAFTVDIGAVSAFLFALSLVTMLTGLMSLLWQPRWIQPRWVRERSQA
jgi:hypothetical protein